MPKKRIRSQPLKKTNPKRILIRALIVAGCLTGALTVGGGVALGLMFTQLPDVRLLEKYTPPGATDVYTANGQLLARVSPQGRYDPIPLEQIPKYLREAVVTAEDKRFWQHQGVDPFSLVRAVVRNFNNIKQAKGTSTITQQLVKNLYLSAERTMGRKLAEAILAVKIEQRYPKEKILEMYLNNIFWGHNVYGIEAAARIYFGKAASQLNLAESAVLAGIIRSPEGYSPYNNPEGALKLKNLVLKQMEEEGRISPQEHIAAQQATIRLTGLRFSYPHPYFLDYVFYTLREQFGDLPSRQGGWKVYTTINLAAQRYAERLMKQQIRRLGLLKAKQSALVCLDPHTGYIQALVGGLDYNKSQFNRAFQAMRQVGSTFKPFVYLAAFRAGIHMTETLEDKPVQYGGWRPRNYDHRFRGTVSLRQALVQSLNIPTVQLADRVGMNNVIEVTRRAGVRSEIPTDLTAALGSSEMTLLELTSAYGVFAAEGVYNPPMAILKIEDPAGNLVFQAQPQSAQVLETEAVRELNLALQGVISGGTGTAANIGRPAAGKTGTTSKNHDAWFVGYTPQLVTGVWVGNDSPSPLAGGGGGLAAPIWRLFMLAVMRDYPVKGFEAFALDSAQSPTPEGELSPSPEITPDGQATSAIIEVPVETPAPTPLPTEMATPEATASVPVEMETPNPNVTPDSEVPVDETPADF